jgi:hypothetical protein
MADEKSLADRIGEQTIINDSHHAHQKTPDRRRWIDLLKHRWPSALGIAVAALAAFDLQVDAGFVSSFSALVVLMALVYLGAAALSRRRAAWVVFLAGFAVLVVLPLPDSGIEPSLVLLVAALAFLVLGAARGLLRRPGGLLQAAGMLGFGTIALTALYADLQLGGYLVAAGLIGHGVWDAYHYLRNRVVARSYAEFCAVLDLLVGTAILVMA